MLFFVGIDVGTGSARAGVFDDRGEMLSASKHTIGILKPETGHAEQSSEEIWGAVCAAVRTAVAQTDVDPAEIKGVSFSATCSLVLRDREFQPVALTPGAPGWDVIVWMDHRAVAEAEECTASKSDVLTRLGGAMSPEMQAPKLMWLKRHRPDIWRELGFAADLGDFLAWKCTGSFSRSVCTLGCKWTFDPEGSGWDDAFLDDMGLSDLRQKARLPNHARQVGTTIGPLTLEASRQLNLSQDCLVATGLIDAHAGALGTLGLFLEDHPDRRLALVAGTSNCHLAVSRERREVPGVWGPYLGAVSPGYFVNEGGQSATGALLDNLVEVFSHGSALGENAHAKVAENLLSTMEAGVMPGANIHVKPDFIGNRSPFADPDMRGEIVGMTLETPEAAFEKIYWATATSIAYGARLIIERLNEFGYDIQTIHLSGGHVNSPLLASLYADATGCRVVLPGAKEPVLLGAAIAAMMQFEGIEAVRRVSDRLCLKSRTVAPDQQWAGAHGERYRRFLKFYPEQRFGQEAKAL